MRRNYNIPLNDTSIMDTSCSSNSSFMPNFLMGNNNQNDSFFSNQTKLTHNSSQLFSPNENKSLSMHNIKRRESVHNSTRRFDPPTVSLRNQSPKPFYSKSSALTNESFYSNDNNNTFMLNQSSRPSKPYERFSFKNNNASIRDSETYSRFLDKSNANMEADENENWVTIFGYPPTEARYVLSYFAEIGNIKEHKISNSGNWMHLHYETKMHAVSALNRNGRILNLNLMIGVKKCTDKTTDVMMPNQQPQPSRIEDLNNSRFVEDPSLANTSNGSSKPERNFFNCSMRSLAATSNIVSPVQEEDRPRGMLSRAMSMVFGRR